ncbi:hypothetical protein [Kaarinaea lacus]
MYINRANTATYSEKNGRVLENKERFIQIFGNVINKAGAIFERVFSQLGRTLNLYAAPSDHAPTLTLPFSLSISTGARVVATGLIATPD